MDTSCNHDAQPRRHDTADDAEHSVADRDAGVPVSYQHDRFQSEGAVGGEGAASTGAGTEPSSLTPSHVVAEPRESLEESTEYERADEIDEKGCPRPARTVVRKKILDLESQGRAHDTSREDPPQRRRLQMQWPARGSGGIWVGGQLDV